MIVGIIFILVGIAILIIGFKTYNKMKASENWPTTEGKIVKSETKYNPPKWTGGEAQRISAYSPDISYRYVVKGVEHTSRQISIASINTADKDHAQKTVSKYPVGTSVSVHYDPQKPDFAFLEEGQSKSTIAIGILIGAFVIIIGIVAVIFIPRL